ncbi:hypothetical protein MMC21_004782 [Puttea exsequens]|nr:hypothetical protein [Puttea exsequens]
MASNKPKRLRLLSSTRPRNAKPKPSLSSRTTRDLIRAHHSLRKQLAAADARRDDQKVAEIQSQIEAIGGLSKYQDASIQGQSVNRGGDTSKVLMEWLAEYGFTRPADTERKKAPFKMLEVGALRVDNACSRSDIFRMQRIDLHSQHSAIKQQDFMTLPTPSTKDLAKSGFDVVSLSLVVNFVGDPTRRGEMLKRVSSFLSISEQHQFTAKGPFPALFLVMPAPCVINSRYLDESRLGAIMHSLGYQLSKQKTSSKLVYYLWTYDSRRGGTHSTFKKEEVRSGMSRNNFAIVLN